MKEKHRNPEKKKPSIYTVKSRAFAMVYPAGFEPVAFRVGGLLPIHMKGLAMYRKSDDILIF